MDGKQRSPMPAPVRARLGATIAVATIVVAVVALLVSSKAVFGGTPWSAQLAPTHTAIPATVVPTATATAAPTPSPTAGPVAPATGGYWLAYAGDNGRSGYNATEKAITVDTLWHLYDLWVAPDWHALTAQVVMANKLAYVGAWDGYERAIPLNSPNPVWQAYLGITSASCHPYTLQKDPGVASTPAAVTVNGTPTLYVGGGDAQLYALNALTGAVKWHTRLGSSPDHFIWSSPAVFGGSVYIGLSSTADCPMVAGQLFKLDAVTGAIQQTFSTVPQGCTGGEVWDAPTLDEATGTVYISTGNAGSCSTAEPYADAIVALSAADLSVVDSWQVPTSQRIANGGFRAAPTLFRALQGHSVHGMVGVGNKNGLFYAFDRTRLSDGPVWQQRVALGGGCLNYLCTQGVAAPAGWDGKWLYVAGGATTVGGKACPGSVQALEPGSGMPVWQDCLTYGAVTAAVTLVSSGANEVGIVCPGPAIIIFGATSGVPGYSYVDPEFQNFYAPASVSAGETYWPNVDGGMHAYGSS